jgi:hypothetical protein
MEATFVLFNPTTEDYVISEELRIVDGHTSLLEDATKFTSRELLGFAATRANTLGRYAGDLGNHTIIQVVGVPIVPTMEWYELEAPDA